MSSNLPGRPADIATPCGAVRALSCYVPKPLLYSQSRSSENSTEYPRVSANLGGYVKINGSPIASRSGFRSRRSGGRAGTVGRPVPLTS